MSGISQVDKILKEKVLDLCWEYLHDNFHKFNETNKIKVSMALCTKNIPQKVEGMDQKQIVIMGEVKKDDSPMRFNIGNTDSYKNDAYTPEYTRHPGQNASDGQELQRLSDTPS